MTTLITDGFDHEPISAPPVVVRDTTLEHHIIYGALGWYDEFEHETIDSLVNAGIIVREKVVRSNETVTFVYTSVHGTIPNKED